MYIKFLDSVVNWSLDFLSFLYPYRKLPSNRAPYSSRLPYSVLVWTYQFLVFLTEHLSQSLVPPHFMFYSHPPTYSDNRCCYLISPVWILCILLINTQYQPLLFSFFTTMDPITELVDPSTVILNYLIPFYLFFLFDSSTFGSKRKPDNSLLI